MDNQMVSHNIKLLLSLPINQTAPKSILRPHIKKNQFLRLLMLKFVPLAQVEHHNGLRLLSKTKQP